MAVRIKLNLFHFLFRLCSFLADKTEGWIVFVKPKLFFGSLLLGWTITSCNSSNNRIPNQPVSNQPTKVVINDKSAVWGGHTMVMPSFPGGERELMKFIQDNLVYPKEALEQGIEGRVICRFLIREDGSIDKVEIQRSLSEETDQEALRIIKSMPQWIPGKQMGENTAVYYTLPILFKKSYEANGKATSNQEL